MSALPQDAAAFPWTEADAMYLLLVRYAADLRNCKPGSEQEEEFDRVSHTLQAYEGKGWAKRKWPRLRLRQKVNCPKRHWLTKTAASFVRLYSSAQSRS
jgi:hypothetical protein